MGATIFYNQAKGTSPKAVFKQEKEEAQWEYGHGGYSGTIAEKSGFSMSRKSSYIDADECVEMVDEFDSEDIDQFHYYDLKRVFNIFDDKWGDSLCVPTEDGFIFCGWASC